MITHTVLITWNDNLPDGQLRLITRELAALPGLVPSLRSYRFGPNVGPAATNQQFAVVATFDDLAGWTEYDTHPEHVRVKTEHMVPYIESRAVIQIES